jgi:hypothetical protein
MLSILGAMILLVAGCYSSRPQLSRDNYVTLAGESDAVTAYVNSKSNSYPAYIANLLQYADRDLTKMPAGVGLDIEVELARARGFELIPAYVCELTSSIGNRYVASVEETPFAIPGPAELNVTLLDRDFPEVWNQQRFSVGWRTAVEGISRTNGCPGLGDVLAVKVASGLPMRGDVTTLYFAMLDYVPTTNGVPMPEVVLVRVEGENGELGAAVYGPYTKGHTGGLGPTPYFVEEAGAEKMGEQDWQTLLKSTNCVQTLAAMMFLASPYEEEDFRRLNGDDRNEWLVERATNAKIDSVHVNVIRSAAFGSLVTNHYCPVKKPGKYC